MGKCVLVKELLVALVACELDILQCFENKPVDSRSCHVDLSAVGTIF